jgi:hypothetical protein
VLVLYEWSEKPYSKDGCKNLFIFGTSAVKDFIYELMEHEKYADAFPVIDSGVGVQELEWRTEVTASVAPSAYEGFPLGRPVDVNELSKNDGLSLADFKAFFNGYDLSQPLASIHFTTFRY